MNIILTPLEAILVAAALSTLSGLVVKIFLNNRYATRAECEHYVTREECQLQTNVLASINKDNKIIFAMLRGIISHLPELTPKERERLLNLQIKE